MSAFFGVGKKNPRMDFGALEIKPHKRMVTVMVTVVMRMIQRTVFRREGERGEGREKKAAKACF